MSLNIPWLTKRVEKVKDKGRDANTDKENELLTLAQERFVIASTAKVDRHKRNLHSEWEKYDSFYRSKQWGDISTPAYKSTPVLNFTFSLVESIVPRLTESRPEVLVLPRQEESSNLAEILNQVNRHVWHRNKMQFKLTELVRSGLKFGTSIIKTIWNPTYYGDEGEIVINIVHPMNFYNDPRAYEIKDMEYCFTKVPRSLEYIARRWPEKGQAVVDSADWEDTENIATTIESAEQISSVTEYWFKDEKGQVCVMYYSGNIVLSVIGGEYDKSNKPVYKHNKFPFTKFVDYSGDKSFWGFGEIEIVYVLQQLINSFEAQIIDNTRLMGNAQWIVDKMTSGLKEEDSWILDDKPGGIIYTQGGGVNRLPGVPIPSHIPQHMDRLILIMEQILGIHDVVQGRRPTGVRAASAIIALQEAANVRIRQKTRNLEGTLQEVAEQVNSLALEFYDNPRTLRLTNRSEFITLDVREALMGYAKQQSPQEFDDLAPVTPGRKRAVAQAMRFPAFDVEVSIGPSVPYSQALVYEQAKEFYQLGAIDQHALLSTTRFPNWEEIIARMTKQNEQMQMEELMVEAEQQEELV